MFLLTDAFAKRISRWNISVISFIYTFTVLVVLAFGLEIEQKITGRGNMEFKDMDFEASLKYSLYIRAENNGISHQKVCVKKYAKEPRKVISIILWTEE